MNIKSDNGNILEITDNDIEIVKNLANNFKFFRMGLSASKTTDVCVFAEEQFVIKDAYKMIEEESFHFDAHYMWDEQETEIEFLYKEPNFRYDVIVELTENSKDLLDELSDSIKDEFKLRVDKDIYLSSIENLIELFKKNDIVYNVEDKNQMQLEFK